MKQTISQLKTNTANTFSRGNIAMWSNYFDTNLESWLYELCDFPFWFLRQEPSPAFWSNFPIHDYDALPRVYGDWVATGWLIARHGVTLYSMASPLEEDYEDQPTWWEIFRAASIDSAKVHDQTGRIVQDLELLPSNEFYDRFYYGSSSNSSGAPKFMTLRTTERGSSIVLWPRPDREYPISIKWTLRESPPYQSPQNNSDQYARFLTWAPSAVLTKCLLQTAIYFNEADMAKDYAAQLYGINGPKMDYSAITAIGGLLGRLKEETYRKNSQQHQQMKVWPSAAVATGRHNPMTGGRAIPLGFGYVL